jgi:glutaredoxin 3
MTLLEESKVYRPMQYEWAETLRKTHEEIHWVAEEVELSEDITDWKLKLSEQEKDFVKHILLLFTQSDVAVGGNYYNFIIPRIKNNEVRNMLGSFAAREAIHQEAYALLLDTLGMEDEHSKYLEFHEMYEKIDWMTTGHSNTQQGLALCLAQSTFNEGVALFASFAMLLNFQRFGKMKGMSVVNQWSLRDESIHVEGNAKIFRTLCAEHPRVVNDELKAQIYQMARDVAALENDFIDLVYKDYEIEGLSKNDLKIYIQYMADRRLIQLGLKGNFGVKENPLPWMEHILSGNNHTNFFEARVTDYSVVGMTGDWEYGE